MRKKLSILIIPALCILVLISTICFAMMSNIKTGETTKETINDNELSMSIAKENDEEQKIIEVTQIPVKYQEVVEESPQEVIENNSYIVNDLSFNESEANMLMKIAMAEAGGEGKECMAQVILTVLNRVQSSRFPNNIYDVIHQVYNGTYQFTPVQIGTYDSAVPSQECKEAFNMVVNGWNESQGSLYFESCVGSSWHSRNLTFLFQCGRMRFYR